MLQPLDHFIKISIHAPLTGSDWKVVLEKVKVYRISIHAPLTGSDGFSVFDF